MLSNEFLAEHLTQQGYIVYPPGAGGDLPRPVPPEVQSRLDQMYAVGDDLLDYRVVKNIIAGNNTAYNKAFELLDYRQLLEPWPTDSLQDVQLGGAPLQFAPSLSYGAGLRATAHAILVERGVVRPPPAMNGMPSEE